MTPDEFRAAYGVDPYPNTEDPTTSQLVRITHVRRARPDLPEGTVLDSDDDTMWVTAGRGAWIWCPGCGQVHHPEFEGEDGSKPDGPCWTWNGRDDEGFGIEPSLLVYETTTSPRCHSFIRDGRWEFLADSTHTLAGQTVPMVPLPDWLTDGG